jgi:tetratricopeptide (TPR) repeat protein
VSRIFLSYRRQDSDYAVLLYAWLTERFGSEQVFWDREDIDPGKDFRRVLSQQLHRAQALVALIGPGWFPSPWIQHEITAALRRRLLILPVLVGDVANLAADGLPKGIRKLAVLQTLDTRDLRFRTRLIEALEGAVSSSAGQPGPVDARARRLAELLRDQSDRRQEQALALLIDGKTVDALEVLNETFELLMALLDFRPDDTTLKIRLGFLYKDLAQAFESTNPGRFRRYVQCGQQIFEALVERKLPLDQRASAWNGLGNIHLLRGEFDQAVECSRRATMIQPSYAHAWADLFDAYEGQARNGKVDLAGLRRAFTRLRATAKGDHLLEAALPRFEASMRQWQRRGARDRAAR